MSQPRMDHNDLARFLDRSMAEEERGSTVAHLSESDADAELLADAAYMLRELEAQDGVTVDDDADDGHADDADTGTDPKVVPLRPPSTTRTRRRVPARWLALAAMVAGVLLVPLALSRSGTRGPGDYAPLLASRDAGIPAGREDSVRWAGKRGSGGGAIDTTVSAQLGALQVDLEVAANAGQDDAVERLSARIVAMLKDESGSGAVAAIYNDIGIRAAEPAETLVPSVKEAREYLVGFVDEDYFSLGAWAETASLAVLRRDAAFFQTRASRKMLNHAASLPSLDDESKGIVRAIRSASESDPPNWTMLAGKPDALLWNIAS